MNEYVSTNDTNDSVRKIMYTADPERSFTAGNKLPVVHKHILPILSEAASLWSVRADVKPYAETLRHEKCGAV